MDLFGEETKEPEAAQNPKGLEDPDVSFAHDTQSDGLKQARSNPLLFGHDKAEAHLLDLINQDRLPHGLIISGPEGIGKATLAYRLARFLLAQPPADDNQNALFDEGYKPQAESLALDPDDAAFRRVASGGHPDLLSIERAEGKNTLDVEQLRKVAPFLRMTASSGGWRIVVIDDADLMNRNAQNALLKILEEPPARALLILVTHKIGALIPTIRSRTQVLNLQTPPLSDFQKILALKDHHFSATETDSLYALSGGSVGKALQMVEEGGLDMMAQILALFESYPNFDQTKTHALAGDLSRQGNAAAFDQFCEIMGWIASQLLFAKARGQTLDAGPLNQKIFHDLSAQSSLEQLIEICEKLKDHFLQVSRANLEKRFAVVSAFEMFKARD